MGQAIQGGDWLGVHKRRWVKVFRVSQQVERVPLGELIPNGCSWEVSELQVEAIAGCWWSMCFEAFGELSKLEDTFNEVVNHVLLPAPGVGLGQASSFAYPSWIMSFRE